jgi:K+:H+ antiporter
LRALAKTRKILITVILLLQIATVLAVARLARWLVVPLGQPAVVGEMVAGLLLGPSFFGWLLPDASAALFAAPTLPALNALSQLGLVLFMFFVGVRVDAHRVSAHRRVALVTSITSIIVPFALGAWLATALHGRLAPAAVGVVPFALFVGAAMSITAFPVLARILMEQRLLRTELGVIAITCAAFDDVTGWLILAGITALVAPDGSSQVVSLRMLLLAGYLAVMLVVVRPAIRWFVARRGSSLGESADDLAAILLVMLLSAVATESLGVHALFGAFFAGLIMPRDAPIERVFADRLEPLTMTLLLPLFFAFSGLRTNVQLISGAAMWRDAALILAAAVAGKAGASTLAARAMGVEWRDASMLGVLLNTRGLIELVVLNIGLDLGILSPVAFSMLVLMALLTTFMTSPIVRRLRERRAAVEQPRSVAAYNETHQQWGDHKS